MSRSADPALRPSGADHAVMVNRATAMVHVLLCLLGLVAVSVGYWVTVWHRGFGAFGFWTLAADAALTIAAFLYFDYALSRLVVHAQSLGWRDPAITIGPDGIFDRRLMLKPLAWHRLRDVQVEMVGPRGARHPYVALHVEPPDPGLKRRFLAVDHLRASFWPGWHAKILVPHFGLVPGADELVALFQASASHYASGGTDPAGASARSTV